MNLRSTAFGIGRRIGKHPLAGRLFCMTERILPLARVARVEGLVAFHHPRPIDDVHILIVPTTPFAALAATNPAVDQKSEIVWNMVTFARRIGATIAPDAPWHMVINGGTRQEIGQVHGHLLMSTRDADSESAELGNPSVTAKDWQELFQRISQADQVDGNGYSVVIHWSTGNSITATLQQSAANE